MVFGIEGLKSSYYLKTKGIKRGKKKGNTCLHFGL
jgi:hypothetical protein